MNHSDLAQLLRTLDQTRGSLGPEVDRARSVELATILDSVRSRFPANQGGWDDLSDQQRELIESQLLLLHSDYNELLRQAIRLPSSHVMSTDYAASPQIYLLGGTIVLMLGAVMSGLIYSWNASTKSGGCEMCQTVIGAAKEYKSATEEWEKTQLALQEFQKKAAAELAAAKKAPQGPNLPLLVKQGEEKKAGESAAKAQEDLLAQVDLMLNADLPRAPSEGRVLFTIVLLGLAGSGLRQIASLVKYVGNRQLHKSWLLYYYMMPFQGAVLAPIVYLLLRVGVLSPSMTESGGTASVNLMSMYAFAALTGLFAKNATDKLSEVFATIFRAEDRSSNPLTANTTRTS